MLIHDTGCMMLIQAIHYQIIRVIISRCIIIDWTFKTIDLSHCVNKPEVSDKVSFLLVSEITFILNNRSRLFLTLHEPVNSGPKHLN